MKRFNINNKALRARITGRRLYIFLDYDGTLVPIVGRPRDARTPAATARLLERFVSLPGCRLAVISGRSLSDVRKRLGIKGAVYVGNHGYEMSVPGRGIVDYAPPGYRTVLSGIKRKITAGVGGIKGIVCEDKRISLAVHFRLAEEEDARLAVKIFRGATDGAVSRGAAAVKKGKKVLEILPPGRHNKGTAVAEILRAEKRAGKEAVFYFGDDKTDEDAFAVLKSRGITVRVGRKRGSLAEYYLDSPQETVSCLREICALREGSVCRS